MDAEASVQQADKLLMVLCHWSMGLASVPLKVSVVVNVCMCVICVQLALSVSLRLGLYYEEHYL